MPSLTLEIDKNGKTKIEGEGFKGKSCVGVIDKVAAALGAPSDLQHDFKPEALQGTDEQVSGG